MAVFFINYQSGEVATHKQLDAAELVDASKEPLAPWHPIQGPSDASTMWYAILRRREGGIFIGTLCLRHTGREAELEARGWEQVPVREVGASLAR